MLKRYEDSLFFIAVSICYYASAAFFYLISY